MSLGEKLERLIAEQRAIHEREKEELRARHIESALRFLESRMDIAPEEVQIVSDDPVRVMVGGYVLVPEYEHGRVVGMSVVVTDSQGYEHYVGWATSLESLAEAIASAREKGWEGNPAQQSENTAPMCPFMADQCVQERCAIWCGGMCSISRLALAQRS
jgi:hypothetical protein